jgi:hypothetical protein
MKLKKLPMKQNMDPLRTSRRRTQSRKPPRKSQKRRNDIYITNHTHQTQNPPIWIRYEIPMSGSMGIYKCFHIRLVNQVVFNELESQKELVLHPQFHLFLVLVNFPLHPFDYPPTHL